LIQIQKSFGGVVVHDGSGSGSPSALAGADEFSPRALSDRDLAILAGNLAGKNATTGEKDEEEVLVDSVLPAEFWWANSR
jgi:hypothetical protein